MSFPNRTGNHSEQAPYIWLEAVEKCLFTFKGSRAFNDIGHIILDATSSTVLLVDHHGHALTQALMYDDKRAKLISDTLIKPNAPEDCAAHGASSSLSKAIWLEQSLHHGESTSERPYICHQIDFINHYFTGKLGISDENNCLKLGYDIKAHQWPDWIGQITSLKLPKALAPGTEIGMIQESIQQKFGLHYQVKIYAGTTDSIAAFLASGANRVGEAVTSLGSSIALKLLADKPIFEPSMGIYSHFIDNMWLIGGASNAGGSVLLDYFSVEQLKELSEAVNALPETQLNFYPLRSTGERFPIADATLQPKLSPRPKEEAVFLRALLEGLTQIEVKGYQVLSELSQTEIKKVLTAGGGTQNGAWMKIRQDAIQNKLNTNSIASTNIDAAYGVARFLCRKLEERFRKNP